VEPKVVAVLPAPAPLPLTPAEERVFWEVIQGYTNKQISDRLFISPRTVQAHLGSIFSKLQLENRAQLVRFALEKGYKPPQT
jgi:DNA-binding CsgD family transcriptional regulator